MLEEQAAAYFRNYLAKKGVVLTTAQFLQHLKKAKIHVRDVKEVPKFLALELINARFSKSTRPRAFQTIGALKPGVYFMDYAEYHKSWGWHNGGATGFMLAMENVTNQLFVHPCKTKETASWESAI